MPAFIIVQVDVTDPEAFATYRDQVPPTLEPFGGEYMGSWRRTRCPGRRLGRRPHRGS